MDLYNNQTSSHNFQVKHAWMIVGLLFAAMLAVSIPVAIFQLIAESLSIDYRQFDAWTTVITTITCYLLVFIIIIQVFGKDKISKSLFIDRHIDWTVYILILFASLSLAVVLEPLSTLLLRLWPMSDWWKELFIKSFSPSITTFIMVAIIAPLCEEVLIRGVILRGLLTSISPQKAIIWSSFFFAFIHLNPWQALPAFIIGLFIGWVYWKTRSIWPCIFIHFANNVFAFIGITIADSRGLGVDTTLQELTGDYFSSLFVVAAVLLPFSFSLLHKRYKLKKAYRC